MPLDRAQTIEHPIRHGKVRSRQFAWMVFNSDLTQLQSGSRDFPTRVNPQGHTRACGADPCECLADEDQFVWIQFVFAVPLIGSEMTSLALLH
jgi:hypothetical protein